MYTSVKGTAEYLFENAAFFRSLEHKARKFFTLYNYSEIVLPALESVQVFLRGVGDASDIAGKQMFRLAGKEEVALRPEGTSQVVRSYIQNGLDKRKEFAKFFYIGAMYRGENPQKGRLREFHHLGVEALGASSAYCDAEIISLGYYFLAQELGINDFNLQINSLGCAQDKTKLCKLVEKKGQEFKSHLCEICRQRLKTNPLRILDCKNAECRKIVAGLNLTAADYLCRDCAGHFQEIQAILNNAGIRHETKTTLVRGLDYYTGTVFEFVTRSLGTQDALGAGGRYDGLVGQLGGLATPACGFAFGMERLMLMMADRTHQQTPAVFVAYLDEDSADKAFALLSLLRNSGLRADMDYLGRSLKAQLRYSQKINAKVVVIIGEEERRTGTYTVKNMNTSEQIKVAESELVASIKQILGL